MASKPFNPRRFTAKSFAITDSDEDSEDDVSKAKPQPAATSRPELTDGHAPASAATSASPEPEARPTPASSPEHGQSPEHPQTAGVAPSQTPPVSAPGHLAAVDAPHAHSASSVNPVTESSNPTSPVPSSPPPPRTVKQHAGPGPQPVHTPGCLVLQQLRASAGRPLTTTSRNEQRGSAPVHRLRTHRRRPRTRGGSSDPSDRHRPVHYWSQHNTGSGGAGLTWFAGCRWRRQPQGRRPHSPRPGSCGISRNARRCRTA
jgi:hypothetical protein